MVFALPTGDLKDKFEVVGDGAVGEELEVLKDDANFASNEGYVLAFECTEVVPHEEGDTVFEGNFAVEGLDKGGFTGADLADEVDELALVEEKADVAQDDVFIAADLNINKSNNLFHVVSRSKIASKRCKDRKCCEVKGK